MFIRVSKITLVQIVNTYDIFTYNAICLFFYIFSVLLSLILSRRAIFKMSSRVGPVLAMAVFQSCLSGALTSVYKHLLRCL